MTAIIKSCGIDYDPYPVINKMKEEYLSNKRKRQEAYIKDPNLAKAQEKAFTAIVNDQNSYKEEKRKKKSDSTKKWWASRR